MKNSFFLLLFLFSSILSMGQKSRWQSLFNGKDLSNWHIYNHPNEAVNAKWKIVNGTITFVKDAKGYETTNDLISNKEYENFILDLQWKIEKGGNSGIFFGVNESSKYPTPYFSGPEIQILDDENHPDANEGKNGNRKAGSLYDMIPSASKAFPAEHWNKIRIKKLNGVVTVWQNGKLAESFSMIDDKWLFLVGESKFKTWDGFGKYQKGHIGLQDHDFGVSFRKIKIKEL